MQKFYKNILLVSLFGFFLCIAFSCRKTEEYPVIPAISFKSFEKYSHKNGVGGLIDDSLNLIISYTDGDGDVGIPQDDTSPPFNAGSPYFYNMVVKYFKKTRGVYTERVLDPPYSARIPDLTPKGNHKAIKGDIKLLMPFIDFQANYDTIHCEVFIYDRALHKSNVITTPDIVVNVVGK